MGRPFPELCADHSEIRHQYEAQLQTLEQGTNASGQAAHRRPAIPAQQNVQHQVAPRPRQPTSVIEVIDLQSSDEEEAELGQSKDGDHNDR